MRLTSTMVVPATLLDVVNHYESFFALGLTKGQKTDLVEFLKSI